MLCRCYCYRRVCGQGRRCAAVLGGVPCGAVASRGWSTAASLPALPLLLRSASAGTRYRCRGGASSVVGRGEEGSPTPLHHARRHLMPSFECIQQEVLRESARAEAAEAGGDRSPLREALQCGGAPDMAHMESPEADEAYRQRVAQSVDDLFSRLPLPADPMAAALAPSPEERRESVAAEMLKEAVREAYWRKKDAERAEEARVERAMAVRFPSPHQPHPPPSRSAAAAARTRRGAGAERAVSAGASEHAPPPHHTAALEKWSADTEAKQDDESALREELDALRRRVQDLEAALSQQSTT